MLPVLLLDYQHHHTSAITTEFLLLFNRPASVDKPLAKQRSFVRTASKDCHHGSGFLPRGQCNFRCPANRVALLKEKHERLQRRKAYILVIILDGTSQLNRINISWF